MANKARAMSPDEVIVSEDALIDFQFAVIKAMNDKKITQRELADKLGITRARMSQILSSEANPTLKLVGRIASALDLETIYISKASGKLSLAAALDTLAELNVAPQIGIAPNAAAGSWFVPGWEKSAPEWHNDNKKEAADRQLPAFAA